MSPPHRLVLGPFHLPAFFEPMNALDLAIARTIQAGYAAVSLLTDDPMPMNLMNTYLDAERSAYDGVFPLSESQVERIIATTPEVSKMLSAQLALLERAFVAALSGTLRTETGSELAHWAHAVINRLRDEWKRTGAAAREDVTTADFAPVVEGVRTRGEEVEVEPEAFNVYISFGTLRLHLEGTLSVDPPSQRGPETLQALLKPGITDTFDFHTLKDDKGTGWMDHTLARLQRSQHSHPFRITGTGRPRQCVVRAKA